MPRDKLIQPRRGEAAEWTAANPVLDEAEFGYETDTKKMKMGDGVSDWGTLTYISTWGSGGGGGSGTVTSVSVTTANGVSGSVATATTTPAITLTLGAITPTSIVASGTITASNLSGTNTGDQTSISGNAGTATALATGRTISITGDLAYTSPSFDGSGNVTAAGTLANVNANVGSFTNASITVNAKGLITAASSGAGGSGLSRGLVNMQRLGATVG